MFYFYQKCIILLLKNSKVHIHTLQITNYILNDILSNFMVNRKVKHKNIVRGKNGICSSTFTLGCSIRNKISTQWPIGKLDFLDGQ
jgi:hypothetical protein